MSADDFNERLARIRTRFAAALPTKIDNALTALPLMSEKSANAIDTIVIVHRTLHEMCGVAPTIGFPATGKAARDAETVLREPAKTKRHLRTDEITALIAGIDGLRSAAQTDLKSLAFQG
ncbi:MAG: Hpt domain-containing protein [Pseudolabrys sp.]|nr:Hpt domain-containing protein [Pseudolabrys sp.]